MAWGDVASWVTGAATAGALVFAGLQVRQGNAQARTDRRIELDGVSVSWRAPVVPGGPDKDGNALWHYTFTAQNPGRLPIVGIGIKIHFKMEVRRLHFDGHIGSPTKVLHLTTPVLPGGADRPWDRKVIIAWDKRPLLTETTATIRFTDLDHGAHANRWSAKGLEQWTE